VKEFFFDLDGNLENANDSPLRILGRIPRQFERLAVSYGILERHRGTISVKSKPGEGTTFKIDLPVGEITEQSAIEESPAATTSSLSVLVVDDEEVVRETLAEMLADLLHSGE